MGVIIYLMRSETTTKPASATIPFAFILTLAFILVACSTEPLPTPTPSPTARVTLASTDLAVGQNRVVFALIQPGGGAIKDAQVQVQTFFLSGSTPQQAVQTAPATFQEWPGGTAGVYRANLAFDRPGDWGLGVTATLPDYSTLNVGAKIQVKQTSSTLPIGSPAPRSHTKTASDADALTNITTDPNPAPGLYRLSISDALDEPKPLLVTFATPAYCRTATCGPQMNVLKRLKDKYADRVNFIHVEVYDNPDEIREQGFSAAKVAPALAEWGLPSEPWTFIMDDGGVIRAKYEGFAPADELQTAISALLR